MDLRQRNASSPTGIFRCTIDVAGEDEPVKKSTYVGLYLGDGGKCVRFLFKLTSKYFRFLLQEM